MKNDKAARADNNHHVLLAPTRAGLVTAAVNDEKRLLITLVDYDRYIVWHPREWPS